MKDLVITTQRLHLVAGTASLTQLAITNKKEFSKALRAVVPEAWPQELMRDVEPWVAETLAKDPESAGWWVWYIILNDGDSKELKTLIGTVGLKGRPQPDGTVEIGYGILEEYQCHGYATEATLALIAWAWQDFRVTNVVAETYPHLMSSLRVMKKCGVNLIGYGSEEGLVRYGVPRK